MGKTHQSARPPEAASKTALHSVRLCRTSIPFRFLRLLQGGAGSPLSNPHPCGVKRGEAAQWSGIAFGGDEERGELGTLENGSEFLQSKDSADAPPCAGQVRDTVYKYTGNRGTEEP